MENPKLVVAAAKDEKERSDAIVVSFDNKWHEKIKEGVFSAIIRRRVPTALQPRWLYFHVNSPIKAICGRAEIRSVKKVDRASAASFTKELALSVSEIELYIGDRETVGIYEIGAIELSIEDLSTSKLAESLLYYPPESYLSLSSSAKAIIDRLGEFGRSKSPI